MTALELQLLLRRERMNGWLSDPARAAAYYAAYPFHGGGSLPAKETYDPEKLIDLLLAELKMQQ